MGQNRKKITVKQLQRHKSQGINITALTAYDFPTANILDEAGMDIILVGDSVGNVVLGYPNTLPVTFEELLHHLKAVKKGVKSALLVADMPRLSYDKSLQQGFKNAKRFIDQGGADAVKIEGDQHIHLIKRIVKAGIPVMGHIGFTPQRVKELGGYKIQGKTPAQAKGIIDSAKRLEKAGVFSIVLEMVPASLGKMVSKAVAIPVIGIGAGLDCDGQILVLHDMLGLTKGKTPRFVKKYADLHSEISQAVKKYIHAVRESKFPARQNRY